MKKVEILVLTLSDPISVGIYKDDKLIETIKKDGKTSDILPLIFEDIFKRYIINKIYYVNGPGSYMSIKIAYLFLKTISIIKNIELLAANGFHFNNDSPIKALGKKYFFNGNDGKITVDFLKEDDNLSQFNLPNKINKTIFSSSNNEPTYNLSAIN